MSFQDIGLKVVLLGVREFQRNADAVDKSIKDTNRSLDSTGTSTKRASDSLSSYSDKADKAGKQTKDLGKETSTLSQKFSDLGSKITTLGVALTAGITVPLNALRATMINTGIEFEDAFSNVGKTVDGVVDDFGVLTESGEGFRKELINISLRLPITATELANVAAAAGQIGIPFGENGEILLEFTEVVSKLAVATNLTAEEGAIQIARFANIYGVAAEDMIGFTNGFANALVALGNTTAANEQEILNFATRLAPFTSLAGIGADATLALGASMAELGIRAEAGSTALSTIIATLDKASKSSTSTAEVWDESNKKMEEGLGKLSRMLQDGERDLTKLEFALQGTGLNLDGVGSMLEKLDGDFSDVNRSIEQTQLRINGYNRDLEGLKEQQAKLRRELANGTITQKEFNEASAKLADRYVDIQANIESANLTMEGHRERLAEVKSEMVSISDIVEHVYLNSMMDLNESFDEMSSKTQMIADILGVTKEEFEAAWGADQVGTLTVFLKKLSELQEAGQISDETLTELGFSGIRVQTVFQAVGGATEGMTSNLDLAADAWVKQTALQAEVTKKFATTKAQIQLMKNAFDALGVAVFDYVKPSFDAIIKSTTELITKFKEFFESSDENAEIISKLFIAASLLGPALIAIGVAIRTISFAMRKSEFGEFFTPIINVATNPAVLLGLGALAGAFFLIKNNVFGLGDIFNRVVKGIKEVASTAIDSFNILGIGKALSNAFGNLQGGNFRGAFGNLKTAWELLKVSISRDILPEIAEQFAVISDLAQPYIERFKLWLGEQFGRIPEVIDAISNFISSNAGVLADKLGEWGEAFINWIKPKIPEVIEGIGEFINAIVDWISTDGYELVKSGINRLLEAISSIANSINAGGLDKSLGYIAGLIAGWASGLGYLLIDALIDISTELGDWIIDQIEKIDIAAIIDSITGTAEDVGEGFVDGFKKGLKTIVGEDTYQDILDSIDEFANSTEFEALQTVFDDLVGGIEDFVKELGKINPRAFLNIAVAVGVLVVALALFAAQLVALAAPAIGVGIRTIVNTLGELAAGNISGAISELGRGFKDMSELKPEQLAAGLVLLTIAFKGFSLGTFVEIFSGAASVLWTFSTAIYTAALPALSALYIALAPILIPLGLIAAAVGIVIGLLFAYTNNLYGFRDAIDSIHERLVQGVEGFKTMGNALWEIGKLIVKGLIDGLSWFVDGGFERWVKKAVQDFIDWVLDKLGIKSPSTVFSDIGKDIVQGLLDGISKKWNGFLLGVINLISRFILLVLDTLGISSPSTIFSDIGKDIVQGLWDGMKDKWVGFLVWVVWKFSDLIVSVWNVLGIALGISIKFFEIGLSITKGVKSGISTEWVTFLPWFAGKIAGLIATGKLGLDIRSALGPAYAFVVLGKAIVDGLWKGIEDNWDGLLEWFLDQVGGLLVSALSELHINSPSKDFMSLGEGIVEGIQLGIENLIPSLMQTMSKLNQDLMLTSEVKATALSEAMVGAATGSIITNTSSISNVNDNSRTFAPTIQGVPMRDESAVGIELARSWRMAQVIGNI